MRLLIAEDDKALSLFLRRGLETEGHRVHTVFDGAQAVEVFRNEIPDLTILDLNLPVKDGEVALQEMRYIHAELPVLVLTGRHEVEARVRCFDYGADDLMTKPFSLLELRARCRALLRRKREGQRTLCAGDLELNRLDHAVRREWEELYASPTRSSRFWNIFGCSIAVTVFRVRSFSNRSGTWNLSRPQISWTCT